MKINNPFIFFAILSISFLGCDSVGTYHGPQQQLDDAQIFRTNLLGLVHNYKLNKDKVGTLCSDSIKKYIKVIDGTVKLNVIDIYMLGQFGKDIEKPLFSSKKAPNLFYYCTSGNSTKFHSNFLAYSYFSKTDTVWDKIKDKSEALKNWLPKLSEWSDKFDKENVAIFYTIGERSKYPKLEGNSYEAGILSGLLILVDWDKIKPVCSIPCSVTNSDEINFNYYAGAENWAAIDKLKDDLISNLGNQLVGKFKELGINQVDSVKIFY